MCKIKIFDNNRTRHLKNSSTRNKGEDVIDGGPSGTTVAAFSFSASFVDFVSLAWLRVARNAPTPLGFSFLAASSLLSNCRWENPRNLNPILLFSMYCTSLIRFKLKISVSLKKSMIET